MRKSHSKSVLTVILLEPLKDEAEVIVNVELIPLPQAHWRPHQTSGILLSDAGDKDVLKSVLPLLIGDVEEVILVLLQYPNRHLLSGKDDGEIRLHPDLPYLTLDGHSGLHLHRLFVELGILVAEDSVILGACLDGVDELPVEVPVVPP